MTSFTCVSCFGLSQFLRFFFWATLYYNVVGSIPDGVIWIFHWHNPSVALWPSGSLNFWRKWELWIYSGEKRRPVRRDDNYYHHVPIVWNSRRLKLLEPSGPAQGCNGRALILRFFRPTRTQRCCRYEVKFVTLLWLNYILICRIKSAHPRWNIKC